MPRTEQSNCRQIFPRCCVMPVSACGQKYSEHRQLSLLRWESQRSGNYAVQQRAVPCLPPNCTGPNQRFSGAICKMRYYLQNGKAHCCATPPKKLSPARGLFHPILIFLQAATCAELFARELIMGFASASIECFWDSAQDSFIFCDDHIFWRKAIPAPRRN
jgi:hypothetical protein